MIIYLLQKIKKIFIDEAKICDTIERQIFGECAVDIKISEKYDKKFVLTYLTCELGLSRRSISRLKKLEDGIVLNGKRVTVRTILSIGDTLSLAVEDRESPENIVPTDIPIEIIYEDEDLIAVNKPPHMPTHPSHGHYTDTLANGLAYYFKQRSVPFVFRAITRLDRDTSGVLLVAKTKDAAYKLSSDIACGNICKCYLAVTSGVPEPNEGRISAYIRRAEESVIKRVVSTEAVSGSVYSETLYETVATNGDIAFVAASPITGRTHQLRLHFAHIGCPMLGDDMYGVRSDIIERQALHAYMLRFRHPTNKSEIMLSAPLPQDILSIIDKADNNTDIAKLEINLESAATRLMQKAKQGKEEKKIRKEHANE